MMREKWFLMAGGALLAASAMATSVVSDTFEGDSTTGWTGTPSIEAKSYTPAVVSIGYPSPSGTDHTKVLTVAGTAQRTAATTANNPAAVDMMVQIAIPDEELTAFPSSVSDAESVQISVGVSTTATADVGCLKVYCKNKSDVAGWYNLGGSYAADSWHRVSFTFDYEHQLCQIRVDGEPVMTANGYLTANTNNVPEADGSWYRLAASTAKSALASVQVIGSTSIDDLYVKDDTTIADVLPPLADADSTTTPVGSTIAIKNSWFEQQGITRGTTTTVDGSGMTVAQKYVAGYDVADGKTFAVKDITLSGSTATVTFDGGTPPAGYSYVLRTSTDGTSWSDSETSVSPSTGTTTDTLSGDVKYYKLVIRHTTDN